MTAPLDLLDLDSLHSAEELEIRAVVRRVVDERVRPYVRQWYEEGSVPARELAAEFGKLGLLGMHLTGYGCAGASAVAYGLACLELEAGDSGVRSLVSVQGSLAMYALWRFGSEEQKQRWLPGMAAGELLGCFGLTEPDHGSDPAGMRTRAVREGGDWVLTGGKMWITNAPVADVAVVWASTAEGIRGFVVPMDNPGVTAREIRHKLSLRASSTGELMLDEVRLPGDAALPEARGLRAPLSCLTEARQGIIWGALGAARDCLHTAIAYATQREQFGRPIAAFQLTQAKLADMALELQKGYLLALHLGRLADRGRDTPAPGDPAASGGATVPDGAMVVGRRPEMPGGLRPEMVSAGKLNNVREALAIARQCRTILGANGISGEYPVLRHANNLESVLTYEGTSEVHQLVLGERLTGLSAFR